MDSPQNIRMLNVGCGPRIVEGWENIDFASVDPRVLSHNLLKGIPHPDSCLDVVYHSHVLEHFTADDGCALINECYRVLKPGGILRVVVPDLEQMARVYLEELHKAVNGDELAAKNREWMTIEFIDQASRHESGGRMLSYLKQETIINWDFVRSRLGHEVVKIRNMLQASDATPVSNVRPPQPSLIQRVVGKLTQRSQKSVEASSYEQIGRFRLGGEVHRWMYDRFSLKELLQSVGFKGIRVVDAFSSSIPAWEQYSELDVEGGTTRKPESLFMEGRKAEKYSSV